MALEAEEHCGLLVSAVRVADRADSFLVAFPMRGGLKEKTLEQPFDFRAAYRRRRHRLTLRLAFRAALASKWLRYLAEPLAFIGAVGGWGAGAAKIEGRACARH